MTKTAKPKLKKFMVEVREVHVQQVVIEAKDYADAIKRIQDGEGYYVNDSLEYSHTLDPDTWRIIGPGDKYSRDASGILSSHNNEMERQDND